MGFFDRGDDGNTDTTGTDDGPTFGETWTVSPDSDGQQWEYRVVETNAVRGAVKTDGRYGSVDEVLNEFGKEGWELVETVEGLRLDGGGSTEGTAELLFKRPATYEQRSQDRTQ